MIDYIFYALAIAWLLFKLAAVLGAVWLAATLLGLTGSDKW